MEPMSQLAQGACTWQICSPQFWEAFWPNAWATLLGVILGLPAAMAINRWWAGHTNKQERIRQLHQAHDAIELLIHSVRENIKALSVMSVVGNENLVLLSFELDTATWEETKADVFLFLDLMSARKVLSEHFRKLRKLERLNERHVSLVLGVEGVNLKNSSELTAQFSRRVAKDGVKMNEEAQRVLIALRKTHSAVHDALVRVSGDQGWRELNESEDDSETAPVIQDRGVTTE